MSGDLPKGACDTHCHVFGPAARFPYSDGSGADQDAPKEALEQLHRSLGVDRTVIVHTARHGVDNRATLDAIRSRGRSCRGTALVDETITEDEIAALHAGGMRGVRFHFMPHLGPAIEQPAYRRIIDRIAPFGWHVLLHFQARNYDTVAPYIDGLEIPFVIDHMGRFDAADGLDQTPFRRVLDLAADPRCWVKISGADRLSATGAPYDDMAPFMRQLVEASPERTLWGTDWPHPHIKGPVPDEKVLLALLKRVAPEPERLRAILVDNPDRLYLFDH